MHKYTEEKLQAVSYCWSANGGVSVFFYPVHVLCAACDVTGTCCYKASLEVLDGLMFVWSLSERTALGFDAYLDIWTFCTREWLCSYFSREMCVDV